MNFSRIAASKTLSDIFPSSIRPSKRVCSSSIRWILNSDARSSKSCCNDNFIRVTLLWNSSSADFRTFLISRSRCPFKSNCNLCIFAACSVFISALFFAVSISKLDAASSRINLICLSLSCFNLLRNLSISLFSCFFICSFKLWTFPFVSCSSSRLNFFKLVSVPYRNASPSSFNTVSLSSCCSNISFFRSTFNCRSCDCKTSKVNASTRSLCSSLNFFRCSCICTSSWSLNFICNANRSSSNDSRNRNSSSARTWKRSSVKTSSLAGFVSCAFNDDFKFAISLFISSRAFRCSIATNLSFSARCSSYINLIASSFSILPAVSNSTKSRSLSSSNAALTLCMLRA